MSVKGVSKSDLYKRASEGDLSQVPIGQTILTNTPELNSPNVRLSNEGEEIEKLDLEMFNSFGHEELQVVRKNLTNEIEYSSRDIVNDGLIQEIAFDKQEGTLHIAKANGKILSVSGFLTQKDFGVGPTGPRGDKGRDADDGTDGRQGKKGETGCAGPAGAMGAGGADGNDGADGDPGGEGDTGCEGTEGPQGPQGPAGLPGFEGSRGFRGDGCSNAEQGPAGTNGQALNANVVVSDSEPDLLSVVWGIPL